ncbi:MAG: hypothetical protein ILM98_03125 [Kiritimatiellae bacterium]|nr:hypothetical protein [Kiritimatiellia bacterium]
MKTTRSSILHSAVLGFAVLGAVSVSADVVGWWRFNGDGAKVPNVANPGTFDGTIQSIICNADQSYDTTFGSDSANMPTVTDHFRGAAPRVIDPVSGVVSDSGKTLSWNAANVAGGMVVAYDEALPMTNFTFEAMIRLPPNAESGRDTTHGGKMFPIAQFGRDQKAGWILALYDGRPWCRYTYKNTSGSYPQPQLNADYTTSYAANLPSLYDGKWHHVAMSFNVVGANVAARLFLDGTQFGEVRKSDWQDWGFSEDRPACPLVIGREPYRQTRTFRGDIAEVRLSRGLLSVNQFLVPLADGQGVADDDTALFLNFDSALQVGSDDFSVVPCQGTAGGATTNCVWYARNWNLMNAAYNQPLVPRWWPFSLAGNDSGDDTKVGWGGVESATFSDVVSTPTISTADTWGDILTASSADGSTTNAYVESAVFASATVSGGAAQNDRIHAISLTPDASMLPTNSYTIEFTFKTTVEATSTAINTVIYCPFLKVFTIEGKMRFRGFRTKFAGSASTTEITSGTINDGEWHHAAYVYDKTAGTCTLFMDYAPVDEKAYTPYSEGDGQFMIGGQFFTDGKHTHSNYQGFDGQFDNFRITRRALTEAEFLRPAEVERLFDARFDDDTPPTFATGLPDYLAPAGTGATMTGGAAAPALADSRAGSWIFDGVNGTDREDCGKALSLDGGYILYPRNRLLECQAFTVEFFAKLSDLKKNANFLRFSSGDTLSGAPIWGLYNNVDSSNISRIYFAATVSADGGLTTSRKDAALYNLTENAGEWENKWHHWALTVEPNGARTRYAFYKDGVCVKEPTNVNADGALYLPPEGTCLAIGGTSASGAYLKGLFDNVRITPGVLSPSQFMQYEPAPFVLSIR